jgi:hypothetical protein
MKFKEETLCSKRHYLSKQTPGASGRLNYEGSCAMTLVTTDVDKLARPMNAGAVKKYFVKKKTR